MSTSFEWMKHPWQMITFRLLRFHYDPDVHLILRFPPRKRLYTHELGMTLAYLLTLSIILIQYLSSPWQCLELILIFSLGTFYLGGFFLFFICLAIFFSYLSPLLKLFLFDLISRPISCILYSEITSFRPFNLLAFDILHYIMMILYPLFVYYILGYILGTSLSVIHRYTMQLHLLLCQSSQIKIAYAFNEKDKLNIIKSPREQEESALLSVIRPITYYTHLLKNTSVTAEYRVDYVGKIIKLIKKAYKKMKEKNEADLMDVLHVEDDAQFEDKMDEIEKTLKNAQTNIENDILSELENQIDPLVEKYLMLRRRKLYNYRTKVPDNHIPYTIAFVANPNVWIKNKKLNPDPILKCRKLFLRSIDKALKSFDSNEMLGRLEIWSRIRIVALFNNEASLPLAQPFPYKIQFDNEEPTENNLLYPFSKMYENYVEMIDEVNCRSIQKNILKELKDNVDVIFSLSADAQYTRATALYSDWTESNSKTPKTPGTSTIMIPKKIHETIFSENSISDLENAISKYKPGLISFKNYNKFFTKYFQELISNDGKYKNLILDLSKILFHKIAKGEHFRFDTCASSKINEIKEDFIATNPSDFRRPFEYIHEYFASCPGRAAINVLSTTPKTFIHEFAHAMSSIFHGAIVDEYYDRCEIVNSNDIDNLSPFYVNRIERKRNPDKSLVPIHKVFAIYNDVTYYSDREHPSAKEDWLGYFPARSTLLENCIMDNFYVYNGFDSLLRDFMYDRLSTKLNRSI